MKSFRTLITEKKDHIIKRLKNLSKEEKDKLIKLFKEKPHLEDLKDKRGKPIINWNNKNLKYDDFIELINHRSKNELKKAVKNKGISGLKEGTDYLPIKIKNDNWAGYIPLTHAASVHIASKRIGGCEGKWCTAYTKDQEYWSSYMFENNLVPIYLIGKTYTLHNGWVDTKYAIVTSLAGSWEMFDREDNPVVKISGSGLDIDRDIINPNKSIIKKANIAIQKHAPDIPPHLKSYIDELAKDGNDVNLTNATHMDQTSITAFLSRWQTNAFENCDLVFINNKVIINGSGDGKVKNVSMNSDDSRSLTIELHHCDITKGGSFSNCRLNYCDIESCTISKSHLQNSSNIATSVLMDCVVKGQEPITESSLHDCTIVGDMPIEESSIRESLVRGATLIKCTIKSTEVVGTSSIHYSKYISGEIGSKVYWLGNTDMDGNEIDHPGRD